MTSPVIASRTPTLISADTATHTINLGSPNAGDLLIVVLAVDGTNSVYVDVPYSGARWWQSTPLVSSSAVTGVVLWKIAQGGGGDALRLMIDGSEQSAAYCVRVTGHGSAVFVASASGSSTNADPPNGAITGSAQDLLLITAACVDATVIASAAPSTYGNLTTQAGAGASGASVSIADKAASSSTGENPGAFTSATEQWVAFTLAIPENAITTNGRTTQEAIEAVSLTDPYLVGTQVALEAISSFVNNAVTTQVAIECLSPQGQNAYVTQAAVEVLSGDPWPSGNRNKYRQIQIAC